MNTKYSFSEFFPQAHPLLQQSRKVRSNFQLEESAQFLLVLRSEGKNWFESGRNMATLKKLKSLTEELREIKGVQSAYSMATLEGAVESQGQILVGPVLDGIHAKDRKAYVNNSPLLLGQLISKDLKSVLIVIEPALLSPQELSVLRLQILKSAKKKMPGVNIELGGGPEVQRQFTEKLNAELMLLLSLSLLCFCLVFLILIQGWRSLILAFTTLMASNLFIFSLIAYFQIPFSVLLSTLPIILSVAVISVVLHTLHRWAEVRHEKGFDLDTPLALRVVAAWQVEREMLLPNFLGSLTTALGFVALCSADIPLIRQYGWVVALSVAASWLVAQIFLFVFMPFVDADLRPWALKKSFWALTMLKQSGPIVGATLALCLVIGSQGRNINFSGRLFDDLSKTDSARRITEKIDRQFGGIITYDLELTHHLPGGWKDPRELERVKGMLLKIRKLAGVGSALAVTDLLEAKPSSASSKFSSKSSFGSKAQLAETLFLYSMAEQNPIRNFLNDQTESLRIAIRFYDLAGDKTQALQAKIKTLLMKEFPQIEIRESGMGFLAHKLNAEVSKELVFGFWQSLVLIGILLVFIFRSLRWALMACLPNLIPPVVLFGLMGVTQVSVKPGVAIIFSIALGLAFNNTVYLLTRLQGLMNLKQGRVLGHLPLRKTLLQEGYPCLFETLIMICGFSIFLFSGFKINQIFGVYMLISIFAGAIGDLVFLPSLLKLWPRLLLQTQIKKVLSLASSQGSIEGAVMKNTFNSERSEDFKKAASFVLTFILISAALPSRTEASEAEVKALFTKVRDRLESKDDEAVVNMKIIEKNGDIKSRKIQLQTKSGKKFFAIARMQAPVDIKGTALLSIMDKKGEDQWLYTPSNQQVRRIVSVKKAGGILGSELSLQDLNSGAIDGAKLKMIKNDSKAIIVEAIPAKGSSPYQKVQTHFSPIQFVPLKAEYFQAQRVVKTVEFTDYKKVGDQLLRAQKITVKNLKNGRGTELELSQVKVNQGLKEEDFSVSALKD